METTLEGKIAALKALRDTINKVIEDAKYIADGAIGQGPGKLEIDHCIENLTQGRMWAGEVFNALEEAEMGSLDEQRTIEWLKDRFPNPKETQH